MRVWRTVFVRCSSARITVVTSISASSTATQKLYTGIPAASAVPSADRSRMKSPTVAWTSHVTSPRTRSEMVIFLPRGTLNRTVYGSPASRRFCTSAGAASRHVPSYCGFSPAASAAARFASSSSAVQKHG